MKLWLGLSVEQHLLKAAPTWVLHFSWPSMQLGLSLLPFNRWRQLPWDLLLWLVSSALRTAAIPLLRGGCLCYPPSPLDTPIHTSVSHFDEDSQCYTLPAWLSPTVSLEGGLSGKGTRQVPCVSNLCTHSHASSNPARLLVHRSSL